MVRGQNDNFAEGKTIVLPPHDYPSEGNCPRCPPPQSAAPGQVNATRKNPLQRQGKNTPQESRRVSRG